LKLSQFIKVLILLGVILITSNNLQKINAAVSDGPENEIVDLATLNDGVYKFEIIDGIGHITNILDHHWIINLDYVNLDYLYKISDNQYRLRIKNASQYNLNNPIEDFSLLHDDYYYYSDNDIDYDKLIFKLKSLVYGIEYTFTKNYPGFSFGTDIMQFKFHSFKLNDLNTVYLNYVEDGEVQNLNYTYESIFNLFSDDYHLYRVLEKLDDYNYKLIDDDENILDVEILPNNYFYIDVDSKILHDLENNTFISVSNDYIDDMIIDIIKDKFDVVLYIPTIQDILDKIKNRVDEVVEKVIAGKDITETIPDGIYAVGDNKLYKIISYDYVETFVSDTQLIRDDVFYPRHNYLEYFTNDLKIDYLNLADDYLISHNRLDIFDNTSLKSFNGYNALAYFIHGTQIDISDLDFRSVLWLFTNLNYDIFTNLKAYQDYKTSNLSDFVKIDNYTDLPDSNGFVKFVKNKHNYYDVYFYNSNENQYYKYQNMDLIDLISDVSNYNVCYFKDSISLIIELESVNEHIFWDVLNDKYTKNYHIFVTGEKQFTFDKAGQYVLSYLHFNLNIPVDKIENITFNYNTKTKYYALWFIKTSESEWTNITKTVKSFDFYSLKEEIKNADIFYQWLFGNSDDYPSNTIQRSNLENYQWQVLLNIDLNDRWYSTSITNRIGSTKIQRLYDDVVLMRISYWKDGEYYEDVKVDDDYPTDGKTSIDDFINDIIDFINNLPGFLKVLGYLGITLFIIFIISIILKVLSFVLSIFGLRKRRYKY